jgi:hypothetical protein
MYIFLPFPERGICMTHLFAPCDSDLLFCLQVWCGCDTERCVSSVVAITERHVSYVLAFRLQFVHHFVLCYFYSSARKGAYKELLLVLSMILFLSVVSVTVNSQSKDYRAASKICSLRFF